MTQEIHNNPLGYCNFIGYTDVNPFEVIKVVSPTCLEIRAMIATKDETVKTHFEVGGFSAHSDNNQKWNIVSDPNGHVVRVRQSKKLPAGYYRDKWGVRYLQASQPRKFYDYNF